MTPTNRGPAVLMLNRGHSQWRTYVDVFCARGWNVTFAVSKKGLEARLREAQPDIVIVFTHSCRAHDELTAAREMKKLAYMKRRAVLVVPDDAEADVRGRTAPARDVERDRAIANLLTVAESAVRSSWRRNVATVPVGPARRPRS